MADDIVRELGYATLGSRLKRIGERMQADVGRLFKQEGLEIAPALVPTLQALSRNGELTVGALAKGLVVAQPGITRNLAQLEAAGLVRAVKRGSDQRTKTIALTKKGEALVALVERKLAPFVSQAVREVCAKLEGPFLAQLDGIEDALDDSSLDARVMRMAAREKAR